MFNAEPVGFYFLVIHFMVQNLLFFSLFFFYVVHIGIGLKKNNNNAIVLSWFGNCDDDMNSFGRICHD